MNMGQGTTLRITGLRQPAPYTLFACGDAALLRATDGPNTPWEHVAPVEVSAASNAKALSRAICQQPAPSNSRAVHRSPHRTLSAGQPRNYLATDQSYSCCTSANDSLTPPQQGSFRVGPLYNCHIPLAQLPEYHLDS